MKTKSAQIATIATIGAAATLAVALFTYPALLSAISATPSNSIQPLAAASAPLAAAATSTATATTARSSHHWEGYGGYPSAFPDKERGGGFQFQSPASLTVGQTITIMSTQGRFFVYATPSKNGTASGTLTFTVTGKLARGYTLSLTSGSIVVNGTTYTVSSGSAQMGLFANAMIGQGSTTPAGQFLFQARAQGSFAGTSGSVSLDFTNGTTEYAVLLAGTLKS